MEGKTAYKMGLFWMKRHNRLDAEVRLLFEHVECYCFNPEESGGYTCQRCIIQALLDKPLLYDAEDTTDPHNDAAPDLLTSLSEMVRMSHAVSTQTEMEQVVERARAAIAKAKGE